MIHSSKPRNERCVPDWLSAELISLTLEVWQPRYRRTLTCDDAIEILLNVAALADVLGERDDEAVFGPGKSFEPRARA